MTVLKPTELKTDVGGVLDKAIKSPQYIVRKGQLLVITKAELAPVRQDDLLSPWEVRSKAIESFYDPAKAW